MAGMELISEQGFRLDGRRRDELRHIACRMGVFSRADGSAYVEQGNTKVLCAVYGPHEVRGAKSKILHDRVLVNCQYSMAVFSTGERKRRPRGDIISQEMSMLLQETFETAILTQTYPRSQLDIYIEVLQSDGGNYCASVNAATLALIDAGVAMKDYVCACSASFIEEQPLVDINYLEESSEAPELIVASLPRSDQIVMLEMNSKTHQDYDDQMLETVLKGCRDVYAILDKVVRKHVTSVANSTGWDS